MMRFRCLPIIALFFLTECERAPIQTPDRVVDREQMETVVFRIPWPSDLTPRKLWQRSYPKEYAELRARAAHSRSGTDPFADQIEIPDDQLTPGSFGMMGWGRGIVRQVFEALGHPLEGSATAIYESEPGTLTVTHTPQAIEALCERFPEFVKLNGGQAEEPNP